MKVAPMGCVRLVDHAGAWDLSSSGGVPTHESPELALLAGGVCVVTAKLTARWGAYSVLRKDRARPFPRRIGVVEHGSPALQLGSATGVWQQAERRGALQGDGSGAQQHLRAGGVWLALNTRVVHTRHARVLQFFGINIDGSTHIAGDDESALTIAESDVITSYSRPPLQGTRAHQEQGSLRGAERAARHGAVRAARRAAVHAARHGAHSAVVRSVRGARHNSAARAALPPPPRPGTHHRGLINTVAPPPPLQAAARAGCGWQAGSGAAARAGWRTGGSGVGPGAGCAGRMRGAGPVRWCVGWVWGGRTQPLRGRV